MIKIKYLDMSRHNYVDAQNPRYADLAIASENIKEKKTLKVVTYNIKHGKKVRQAVQFFKNQTDFEDVDVICLQEMDDEGVKTMAQELKYNYVYYPAVIHPRYGRNFGNAILSRRPILSDDKIILPFSDKTKLQRIAVRCMIMFNQVKITVTNVHMKVFLTPEQRCRQVRIMVHSVPEEKYCIVAGDFNTFTKKKYRQIVGVFQESDFRLATENIGTYPHWYLLNKTTKLDHIFVKGLKIIRSGHISSRKSSDHFPIWTELALPEEI